jgi:hypothetical protein
MSEEHPYLKLAGKITTYGGAIAILAVGGSWVYDITDNLATKEYHEHSIIEVIAPIQKSLENNEAASLVQRIQNILDIKCRTNTTDLDRLLRELRDRYTELVARTFAIGGCRDGKRITIWDEQ